MKLLGTPLIANTLFPLKGQYYILRPCYTRVVNFADLNFVTTTFRNIFREETAFNLAVCSSHDLVNIQYATMSVVFELLITQMTLLVFDRSQLLTDMSSQTLQVRKRRYLPTIYGAQLFLLRW